MAKLAINGGEKYRKAPFPPFPVIGDEEANAAYNVIKSGKLSTFLASPGEYFNGGKKIKELESLFKQYFNVGHAVSMNSATACLDASISAVGVQPGDQVLVTPYSMTCSATCTLMSNAVPIFCDVNDNNFAIDPTKLEDKINEKTKAIVVVHLFGGPADMDGIMSIADKHHLKVIEDCAQAIGGTYKGKLLGTIGDCGIFSFNEGKHITCGEGGVLITNDEEVAHVSRLVRNHGEAIIENMPREYKTNILGRNYRLTEQDAAVAIEQFKKLDNFIDQRLKLAEYFGNKIEREIPGITFASNRENGKNVYNMTVFKYDENIVGLPRNLFIKALSEEGIPLTFAGYVKPLYLSPIYHDNKHFAIKHFAPEVSYDKGICPVVERLHEKEVFFTMLARPPATLEDMDDIVGAMKKVIDNKSELEDLITK
jgi:dTDP-4-amino-4,6-dideoxygalactose transaminase